MEINSLPVRIVSGVKGAAIGIEFVRKYENKLFAGSIGCLGHGRSGCLKIDETVVSGNIGDLACSIGSSEVETTLVCLLFATQEMGQDRKP